MCVDLIGVKKLSITPLSIQFKKHMKNSLKAAPYLLEVAGKLN